MDTYAYECDFDAQGCSSEAPCRQCQRRTLFYLYMIEALSSLSPISTKDRPITDIASDFRNRLGLSEDSE